MIKIYIVIHNVFACYVCQVCGSVVRQPLWRRPDEGRLWERGWLAVWWLASIIFTSAFTCNLIAFLTAPVYPTRVETVAQIAQSNIR